MKIVIRIIKKFLPKVMFNFLRSLGNAFFTPVIISYETGHFFSAILNKPLDKKFKALPWYTYPAINFLDNFNYSKITIIEFGSGNSTFWWAHRAEKVISFENDKEWFNIINKNKIDNIDLNFVDSKFLGEKEIIKIRSRKYNIIIIDGNIDRYQTLEVSEQYLTDDGFIIIDNSEGYFEENNKFKNFPMINLLKEKNYMRIDFYGYVPGLILPHSTSIFFKNSCFLFDQKNFPPMSQRSDFYSQYLRHSNLKKIN